MKLIKSGLVVGFLTLISRILGFVRDIFITSILGANFLTDAFNIAFRLPNFFRRIFAEGAFSSAFIPIFTGKMTNEPFFTSKRFSDLVFIDLAVVLFFFVLLLELIMPYFLYVMAPGYIIEGNGTDFEIILELSRIAAPYLFFIALCSMIGGVLNANEHYIASSFSPILLNLVIIIFILLPNHLFQTKAHALIYGVLCAGAVQLFAMFMAISKTKYKIAYETPHVNDDIITLLKKIGPGIVGGGLLQISILIDQALASFLPDGSISILSYADRVNQLPLAIIGTAIGTVLLPTLSKHYKAGDMDEFHETKNRSVEVALLLTLPCTLALIVLGHQIIGCIFERGAFTHHDSVMTANALIAFAIGLPAYVINKILSPSFFASGDTKTPVRFTFICLIINIALSLALMPFLAHVGIALATSISAWLNIYLQYNQLVKNKLFKPDSRLIRRIYAISISSVVMAVVLAIFEIASAETLLVSPVKLLLTEILTGCLTFVLSGFFLNAFDVREIIELMRRKKQ